MFVESENFAEEAGLFLLLSEGFVVVVDLGLVYSEDALLFEAHRVYFDHWELLVLRGFGYSDGHFDSVLFRSFIDVFFGFDLSVDGLTKMVLDSRFLTSKSLGSPSVSFLFSVR